MLSQGLECRGEIVHHSGVTELCRLIDTAQICVGSLVGATEVGERIAELAPRVALILGQGEVQLGELPVVVGGSFAIDADADDPSAGTLAVPVGHPSSPSQ